MKLQPEKRKKLNAVKKALLLGVPISGMMLAAGGSAVGAEQQAPAKKNVSIDQMSLSYRRFSTPGIIYPPPMKVQVQEYKVKAGDTWESLAKRHKTTVEIMLRINGIPAEKVWEIVASKVIPENLKLAAGQTIYVPEKITSGKLGENDDE